MSLICIIFAIVTWNVQLSFQQGLSPLAPPACPAGFQVGNLPYCFFVYNLEENYNETGLTWAAAKGVCRNLGASLAVFDHVMALDGAIDTLYKHLTSTSFSDGGLPKIWMGYKKSCPNEDLRPIYRVANQDTIKQAGFWQDTPPGSKCGAMDLNAVNEFASGKAKGADWVYKGCFNVSRIDGATTHSFHHHHFMTTGMCRNRCYRHQVPYSGLNAGSLCACFPEDFIESTIKVEDSYCQYPCNGNTSEMCGGEVNTGYYGLWKLVRTDRERGYPMLSSADCSSRLPALCMRKLAPFLVEQDEEKEVGPETCDQGWCRNGNSCFQLANLKFTWEGARYYCVNTEHGNLASIHSPQEQEFLQGMIELGEDEDEPWIGLHLNDTSKSDFSWEDNTPYDFKNLKRDTAMEQLFGSESCVSLSKQGKWQDRRCDLYRPLICKRPLDPKAEPTIPVPSLEELESYGCPAEFFEFDGICYQLVQTPAVYSHTLCHASQHRASLAYIRNGLDNAFLQSLLLEKGVAKAWIGLYRPMGNRLHWVNEKPMSYLHHNIDVTAGTVDACFHLDAVSGFWKSNPHLGDHPSLKTFNFTRCHETPLPYLCSMPPVPSTSQSSARLVDASCSKQGYSKFNNTCYSFVDNPTKTWAEAEEYCNKDNAHLVWIESEAEWAYLIARIRMSFNTASVWTGLHLNEVESLRSIYAGSTISKTFIWSNGDSFEAYTKKTGDPAFALEAPISPRTSSGEYRCATIQLIDDLNGDVYKMLSWKIAHCGVRRKFVCKYREEFPSDSFPESHKKAAGGSVNSSLAVGMTIFVIIVGVLIGGAVFLYRQKKLSGIKAMMVRFTNPNWSSNSESNSEFPYNPY